jgi:hypothetical protein
MKALAAYQPSELCEMGIGSIWIGFEGMRAGYKKMQGAGGFAETIAELKKYGIHVVLCMIIGFDYQTPEIIEEELAQFIACKPSLAQFMIYGPSGGTPLLERMKAEGRLNERYLDKSLHEGYSLLFHHPTIAADEMERLLRDCYRREYQANGPSIYRVMETNLAAYLHLRGSDNPRLRERARQLREFLEFSWGAHHAGLTFAPNDEVRRTIVEIYAGIERHIGRPSIGMRALSRLAPAAAAFTGLRQKYDLLNQPRTKVRQYHWAGQAS